MLFALFFVVFFVFSSVSGELTWRDGRLLNEWRTTSESIKELAVDTTNWLKHLPESTIKTQLIEHFRIFQSEEKTLTGNRFLKNITTVINLLDKLPHCRGQSVPAYQIQMDQIRRLRDFIFKHKFVPLAELRQLFQLPPYMDMFFCYIVT
jgi:hypothetical protein